MSVQVNDATTLRIASGVRFRRENFGGLIFRRPVAVIYGLTHTGYRVLELCDGTRDVGLIAATVAAEYGVRTEVVRADLEGYLDDLRRSGFVEPAGQDVTGDER